MGSLGILYPIILKIECLGEERNRAPALSYASPGAFFFVPLLVASKVEQEKSARYFFGEGHVSIH